MSPFLAYKKVVYSHERAETLVSCLLGRRKHVSVGALQQDQRRGRSRPLLHLLVIRGALGDPAGRRPGEV